MKLKSAFYKWIVFLCMLLISESASAQKTEEISQAERNDTTLSMMDNVEISLLTVGPGDEVWSMYGHTALRVLNHNNGTDVSINYGSFSFDQPYFILRFIFGLTDYEMAILPMQYFMEEYKYEGRWVSEQKLSLNRNEKRNILAALQRNALPQNVGYRYNFLYDNCTTRAMNILLQNVDEEVESTMGDWNGESYRTMTHQWTENHRWARFGNDLLLGVKADFKTERESSFFLPDSVRHYFNNIYLKEKTGRKRKLVNKESYLYLPESSGKSNAEVDVFDKVSPTMVLASLFVVTLLLTAIAEWKRKHSLWMLDAILLVATGLCGLILSAMIFSEHPTVRVNLQILILNPLSLLFLYSAIRKETSNQCHWYWKVLLIFCILFLIGIAIQTYAEGMVFVAMTLVTRCVANIRNGRHC